MKLSLRRGALYYESPVAAPSNAPHLLLITYSFPPAPAVGSLRWQETTRILTEAGWGVDVVARDFSELRNADLRRLERLPAGVRIFSVPDREPLLGRAQKILWPALRRLLGKRPVEGSRALSRDEIFQQRGPRTFVRMYLSWIEFTRDGIWANSAAAVGRWLCTSTDYAAVVTSGPPHMAHEAGRLVSISESLPHIVDMRDPWSLLLRIKENVATPYYISLARKYESRVVANASLVTMNTPPACEAMRGAYPEYARKFEVVRNGADDDVLPPPRQDSTFRLRFAGSIYLDRNPRLVFRAARAFVTRLKLTPDDFIIELFGEASRYEGTLTTQIAEDEGITEYVRVGGRMHRQQTMEFLASATMLLSLPQDSDFAVPAKLYEYVRFHAWMLVLATAHSSTAQVFHDSGADIVDPDDVDAIAAILQLRYEEFRAGIVPRPVGWDGRFDRKLQVQHFVHLLEEHTRQSLPKPILAPQEQASEERQRSV